MAVASHITAILLTIRVMLSFAAGPPTTWIQAGTGEKRMCAGALGTCDSVEACTYHAYGPCGGASAPSVYIEGSVTGMALIKGGSEAYLSDSTKVEELTPSNVANNGYRTQEDDAEVLTNGTVTATFAGMQAGAYYGSDPATSGGFLGMASYLLKTGTISTNTNSLLVPQAPGQASTSVVDVCIAERTPSGSCGSPITYTEGEYKFSLFGYTTGTSFSISPDVTHFGFRTKMKLVGAAADLKINGDKTLATIGTADVSQITVTEQSGSQRQITITFPNKYNTGAFANLAEPEATKTVKIKISDTELGDQSIYIDYLFEKLTAANYYFVYDPDSKETTGSGSSKAYHAAVFVPLVIAFVSGLVHI